MRINEVARIGEGFDFWVSNDEGDFGLEVSGTLTDDLSVRHREKVRQLLANRKVAGGYVVVVGFAENRVVVSFHLQTESES